jgi:hypothetical protein
VKFSRALLSVAISAAAVLSLCASADAAIITVGPGLEGSWESEECGIEACTFLNSELGGAGANLRSPMNGAIVGFNVVGGSSAGTYRLGTALQFAKNGFTFRRWAPPVTVSPTGGVQHYATVLPVEQGMLVALSLSESASLGFREGVGQLAEWAFEPSESENSVEDELYSELAGFNAEIQPPPTIASISATSGSTAGGAAVAITGTDLENATAVTFGSAPAASFVVGSESQIIAVAPASAIATAVPISVSTVAGKATAAQSFQYEVPPAPAPAPAPAVTPPPMHCVVPNLIGKKLQAAKAALVKAKCKLGTVKKLGGATVKTAEVSKQGSKKTSQLPVDSKISVTLKPTKPVSKKHGKK